MDGNVAHWGDPQLLGSNEPDRLAQGQCPISQHKGRPQLRTIRFGLQVLHNHKCHGSIRLFLIDFYCMPVKRAAYKALRQNTVARARNLVVKQNLKKLAVRLRKAYTAKQIDEAKKITSEFIRALDKAVHHGVLHNNTASRKKSRLSAQLKKATA